MTGADLAAEVTTPEPYVVAAVGETRFTVAALDLGIKAMTPRRMAERGIEVARAARPRRPPTTCSPPAPDGVFLSNGPGDPATAEARRSRPARACSARASRSSASASATRSSAGRSASAPTSSVRPPRHQPAGAGPRHRQGRDHRAQPRLRRRRAAGRGLETAVRPGRGQPRQPQRRRRRGAARCSTRPAFSVQYHPEAAAGPHDAAYLFDRFARCSIGGGDADAEA